MVKGSPGGLKIFLRILSVVMVVAGSATVLLGLDSLPGTKASAVADSEMRFYAVWYVLAGILLWRSIETLLQETRFIRMVSIAFFVAGCARGLSWIVTGTPHWSQIALMIVELALPIVILPWQAASLPSRADRSRSDEGPSTAPPT
jgi:Domain of unknown function (DUF4345)